MQDNARWVIRRGVITPLRPGRGRDGPGQSAQAVNQPEFQTVATQWLQFDEWAFKTAEWQSE